MAISAPKQYEPVQQRLIPYVWIRERLDNGFVEFNFALGEPSLYVEMILPELAFKEFCRHQQAVFLTPEQQRCIELDELKWRYGAPQAVHDGSSAPLE